MEEVFPHIIWWQIWGLYQRIIITTIISRIQEHGVKETLKRNVENVERRHELVIANLVLCMGGRPWKKSIYYDVWWINTRWIKKTWT